MVLLTKKIIISKINSKFHLNRLLTSLLSLVKSLLFIKKTLTLILSVNNRYITYNANLLLLTTDNDNSNSSENNSKHNQQFIVKLN